MRLYLNSMSNENIATWKYFWVRYRESFDMSSFQFSSAQADLMAMLAKDGGFSLKALETVP
ncbi:hypothetical protein GJA_2474 [Janthinobacterium agaricidamnosum NBRC 102515 = DSM 9628]|uniref:Uncharacterized protein n=1 Tax=Janthinobacterium agaricidamnosum NBRC 102515 = DSM 9628 TaxID=1349767 RepID=W0V684_9BURK|nr:hypothetical protein GJA_2474 [Janthinobacterium agaricidamnosum NBRC 102515 = DSM 9628]